MEEKSLIWKLFHSLWVLMSFILLLNGVGIMYAGFKTNTKNWKIEGLLYEFFAFLFFIAAATVYIDTFGYIYILSWLISIIRSFWILKEYLNKITGNSMNSDYSSNTNYNQNNNIYQSNTYDYNAQNSNQQYNTQTSNQQYNTQNTNLNSNKPDISTDFNRFNNSPSHEISHIQNKPINDDQNDSNKDPYQKLLDINNASLEELLSIPTVDMNLATKIIKLRQSGAYINSLNDLKRTLNLNDNQIEQLKPYIIIKNISKTSNNHRKIDL